MNNPVSPTITVEAIVNAPVETVWAAWSQPEHVVQWNAASDDWHSPSPRNDLRVGGTFCYRMEAKDQSVGFDFEGEYTEIIPHQKIAYAMGDDRNVVVEFLANGASTTVRETFTADASHPLEVQQAGWQSILNNFRRHAESLS